MRARLSSPAMSAADQYQLALACKNRTEEEYVAREQEVRSIWQREQEINRNLLLGKQTKSPLPHRSPSVDAFPKQLELFAAAPSCYDVVEKWVARLPRQRQREHFRKVFLARLEKHGYFGVDEFSFESEAEKFERECEARGRALAHLDEVLNRRIGLVLSRYSLHEIYVKGDKLPFYLCTATKLKELAYQFAKEFSEFQFEFFAALRDLNVDYSHDDLNQLTYRLYQHCGKQCENYGFPIPYWHAYTAERKKAPRWEQLDIALNKIVCERYWLRTLRTVQKRMVEHISIASGEVQKNVSAYISAPALMNWRAQIKSNNDYLRKMIVENVDDPREQAELFEMYLRSSANPALRRIEMMTRLNGIEQWADENGYQALFLTLTAPSVFHATHHNGGQNRKWEGMNPRETQDYLNLVWKQYRALLSKRKMEFRGMRVAEPHHDGTPHWHILAFVKKDDVEEAVRLFKKKALELHGNEQGAKKRRCKVEYCDRNKGSVVAYAAKYVSKNIDGFALDGQMSDEVPGVSLRDNASRARAWASLWGLRQFQFFGTGSIGVWRELRRLLQGQSDDQMIEKLRACADCGCYASYFDLQQSEQGRALEVVKLKYEETPLNKYGETRQKVVGVKNQFSGSSVISRLKRWIIKKRPTDFIPTAEAQSGGLARPWTCVSNCNPEKAAVTATDRIDTGFFAISARLAEALSKKIGWILNKKIRLTTEQLQELDKNGEVRLKNGRILSAKHNEIRLLGADHGKH